MKERLYCKLYFISLLMVLAIIGTACSDNDNENNGEPYVNIDITDVKMNRLGLTADGDSATVFITSNVYWQSSMDDSAKEWLAASLSGGYGNTEVILRAKQNTSNTNRTGKMTLETLSGQKYTINVSQSGTNEVVYYVNENLDGTPTSMLSLNLYDAWNNQGISGLAFRGKGEGVFVDNSSSSVGYADASGENNIYFKDENSYVVLSPFATKGERAFKLSFGSMSTAASFNSGDLILQISKDNSFWVDIDYSRVTTNGWAKSETAFYYDDAYTTLYFRIIAKAASTFRIDDIIIEESTEGIGEKLDLAVYVDDGREPGFIYFQDDFSWITIGPDFINNTADATKEVRFDNLDGQAAQDPTQNERLQASEWTWPTNAFYIYMHKGYVKIGTAALMGVIITPAFKEIGTGSNPDAILGVQVSFDASMYLAVGGGKDQLKPMIVTVEEGTPGTINNGTSKSASFMMEDYNNKMKTYTFKVYGATSTTRLRFQNYANGQNRMFLDNVKVEKIARGS